MVTVNVSKGTYQKSFLIHKEFLCHYSPYFDAAFNGNFQEGANLTLDLEDTSPNTFDIFLDWLYTQKVPSDLEKGENGPDVLRQLVDLWLLADRLLIPKLQNEALVALEQTRIALHVRPKYSFNHVYENTVEGSPLRRYMVQLGGSGFPSHKEIPLFQKDRYSKDMLFDMVNFMRTGNRENWVKFSEEELKQFFVSEGETTQKKD